MLQEITRLGFEFTAGVSVAAYVADVPAFTEAAPEIESRNALARLSVMVAVLDGSAALMAIKVAEGDVGIIAGAVYVPSAFIVPTVAFPPEIPFTVQVTAVLVVLLTVATKVCCSPNKTDAVDGAIVTVMSVGGCDGPAPTAPQPTIDETRSNGRQQHSNI